MTIVCATNFTPASRAAAEVAAHLAHKRGTRLHLLHILPDDLPSQAGTPVQEAFALALREECTRLHRENGVEPTGSLVQGDLSETLREELARQQASLLVVGAPRPSKRPLGLGGNLDRLVQASTVPLLRIRDAAPWHAWLAQQQPLRVMVAVDRSPRLEAAVEWVRTLSALGPLEILAGHVFYAPEAARRFGLPEPKTFDELSPSLEAALTEEVARLAARGVTQGAPHVRLQPGLGRVSDHLLGLAEQEGVELLVLGTHARRGVAKLWSASHQTLRLGSMAVAVVPEPSSPDATHLPHLTSVLAATDFSPGQQRAIAHAFATVAPGGTVHLVHVSPLALPPDERQRLMQRLLQQIPEEAVKAGKVAVPHVVIQGDAAQGIVETAERVGANLLCLGTHGQTRLAQVVLGSVASRVVQRSARPVLLVRME